MGGICGAATTEPGPPVSVDRLEAMMHALRHRGPDSSGRHRGPGVAMGARRLSIIDVSGGHQPLTDDTKELVVVGNGEIYNHVELRRELESRGHRIRCRSDMAVVPHLYREHGEISSSASGGCSPSPFGTRRAGAYCSLATAWG